MKIHSKSNKMINVKRMRTSLKSVSDSLCTMMRCGITRKPLNVITLGHTKSDNINRLFYLVVFNKWNA